MADAGESESLLAYAGVGGATICCLGIEPLGGAAILGGVAATVGLSTGLTYLVVTGLGGLLVAVAALGYRQMWGLVALAGGAAVTGGKALYLRAQHDPEKAASYREYVFEVLEDLDGAP